MPEFKYRLSVAVQCVSVPEKEDIPEHATVEFSTHPDNKLQAIQEVLLALSKAWPEMRVLHKLKENDSDGGDM